MAVGSPRLARQVEDICHIGIRSEIVLLALKETVEAIVSLAPEGDGQYDKNNLTFLLSNGSLTVGFRWGKELLFSTYKDRCPERNTCHAFEFERCERPVKDGIIKHLVVTSENIGEGPNIWQEMTDGEYVLVDQGMNFRQDILLPYQTKRSLKVVG